MSMKQKTKLNTLLMMNQEHEHEPKNKIKHIVNDEPRT